MEVNNSYVLVVGASIVDILGFSRSKYTEKDSIPGNIKISLGGVCLYLFLEMMNKEEIY